MMSLCTVEINITDANNNPPVFPSSFYEVKIRENVDPTSVAQVSNFCYPSLFTLVSSSLATRIHLIAFIQSILKKAVMRLYQINILIFILTYYLSEIYTF